MVRSKKPKGSRRSRPQNARFRFRWKYAVSAFLVCGVLSFSIGKNKEPDPLLVMVESVTADYDKAFKINKDIKTATSAELDGPEEKTYDLDSPVLVDLQKKIFTLGQTISRESFARARFRIDSEPVVATAAAVKAYMDLRRRLYENYLRLAHDADYATYRRTNYGSRVWDWLTAEGISEKALDPKWRELNKKALEAYGGVSATGYSVKQFERWKKLNRHAVEAVGARKFTDQFYDYMNIRIDPKTAQILYGMKDQFEQFYNIRNVTDDSGHYTQVEVFMNSFIKQMAEYKAINSPKDKPEYLKLLQFAAVREAFANRKTMRTFGMWAVVDRDPRSLYDPKIPAKPRSLAGLPLRMAYDSRGRERGYQVPAALADENLNACAPDLVSFRPTRDGAFRIDDLEAYSSLWADERHNDLMRLGAEAAAKATAGVPLLSDAEYAELFAIYVSGYKGFQTEILAKYGDDVGRMLADMTEAYGPAIRNEEEAKWSNDRIEEDGQMSVPPSVEKFMLASLPADDLRVPAVVARYVDQASLMRAYFLAEAMNLAAKNDMVEMAAEGAPAGGGTSGGDEFEYADQQPPGSGKKVQFFPEANTKESKQRAVEVAKAYLDAIPPGAKESRLATWRRTVAARVQKALDEKLGPTVTTPSGSMAGVGYFKNLDVDRLEAFEKDLMPTAAIGARGVLVRRAGEEALKKLRSNMLAGRECRSNNTGYPGTYVAATCVWKYPDPSKMTADQRKDPNQYVGYAPFRVSARDYGIKDMILPETATQVSQFFKKKLNVVLAWDNKLPKYGEPGWTRDLAEHEIAMGGMTKFFGLLEEEVKTLSQSAGENPDESCAPYMPALGKGNEKAARNRKPAFLGWGWGRGAKPAEQPSAEKGKVSPEECSMPTNDEAEGRRRILEKALAPAAKKAYQAFLKEIETPPKVKSAERVAKRNEEKKKEPLPEFLVNPKKLMPRAVADNTRVVNNNPHLIKAKQEAAREEARKEAFATAERRKAYEKRLREAAERRRAEGYFRPGKDHSYDTEGGELYVEKPEDRKRAIELFKQGLAVLGLLKDATGEEWVLPKRNEFLPHTPGSWTANEWIRRAKYAGVRPLERMVATISDQIAMGQVFAQEAISRAPILMLQPTWESKTEKKEPNLLERIAGHWSPERGWGDGYAMKKEMRATLAVAGRNDLGKAETFCRADIKNYQENEDFRRMFRTITGIRDILSTDEGVATWDGEIQKEQRTWKESIREDYIDPYSIPLMIAVGIGIVFQLVLAAMSGGLTLAFSGQALIAVAKFIALQMVGNFGVVTLIFSFQTYLMVCTYHFDMPPQLKYSYQVANSRVQNMDAAVGKRGSMGLKWANMPMVDREKLHALREELNSQQLWTNVAIAGEVLQAVAFTRPGVLKTLGFRGQKVIRRLASNSAPETLKVVRTQTLRELVKEKGLAGGIREYWKEAGPALKNLRRKSIVKTTKTVDDQAEVLKTMNTLLKNKLASYFRTKDELRHFYLALRETKVNEILRVAGLADEKAAIAWAKQMKKAPIDLAELGPEMESAVRSFRKEFAERFAKGDLSVMSEQLIVAWPKALDSNLVSASGALKARDKAYALLKSAKMNTLTSEVDALDDLLKNLDDTVKADTADEMRLFFEKFLDTEGIDLHRKFLVEGKAGLRPELRPGIFKGLIKAGALRAYKDYDYLLEDWKAISPSKATTRAISEFIKSGKAYIYYDEKGFKQVFDPKKYEKAQSRLAAAQRAYGEAKNYGLDEKAIKKAKAELDEAQKAFDEGFGNRELKWDPAEYQKDPERFSINAVPAEKFVEQWEKYKLEAEKQLEQAKRNREAFERKQKDFQKKQQQDQQRKRESERNRARQNQNRVR